MESRSSPSGQYHRLQDDAWAFVPAPLPPTLVYSSALVRLVAEANLRLGELAGLARQIPNPHLLIQPFVKREAVLSSRIEGTEADAGEIYAFEAAQKSLPGLGRQLERDDVREVSNYVRCMDQGLELLTEMPVSLRLIRTLHATLLRGVRGRGRAPGEFRRTQNWIGPPGSPIGQARYIPPPVPRMQEALFALEEYLHDEEHDAPPLIRLALLHYQFEAIHPFLDGNGRIGRLLVALLLVDWELLPLPLLYLSAYIERRRQQFYDLLAAVTEHGEWSEWLAFFLQGVATQAVAASQLVLKLQGLQGQWRDRLTRPGGSALAPKLVDGLFAEPFLTIPIAGRLLEVTYPTAKRHVETLVEAGILRELPGSGNPKVFVAQDIIDLASEPEN